MANCDRLLWLGHKKLRNYGGEFKISGLMVFFIMLLFNVVYYKFIVFRPIKTLESDLQSDFTKPENC